LDPDPELLRESANKITNPKFHALNSALVQLVSCDLVAGERLLTVRAD
jgi:hypothetical protein